jgi:drug/metabolite transporter (DMT)-like permease
MLFNMTIFIPVAIPVALVIAGFTIWGLITSLKRRGIDRRHFAAFIGFSAAVIAVIATTVETIVADLHPHPMDPALGGFLFATGVVAIVSMVVTFFAGFFSWGYSADRACQLRSCGRLNVPICHGVAFGS